jgi:hypothetical protein
MASVTVLSLSYKTPPEEMWTQLKPVNQDFALRRIENHTWDFTIDVARFSLASIENTSANDLVMQQALQQFSATAIGIRDQLLDAFSKNTKQYGQSILEDLNRHLSLVHTRLQDITRESASLSPAVKESLASVNASTSALTALIASLKLPSTKGEIGEANTVDSIRSAFLAVPNVSIEQLGGPGETDAIVHFDLGGLEIAKVIVECKNRTAWSNAFLSQIERDMLHRSAQFGVLVTSTLPRDARSRGFVISERSGIVIVTRPDLAPGIMLMLYELVRSIDRLSDKAQTLQTLLRSRELMECVTNNLSLIQPLQNIIKTMEKAHVDITTMASSVIDAIQRNNAKLAENLPQNPAKGEQI